MYVLWQWKRSRVGNTYRRDHTVTLSLPVRHIATMVNDDMAGLTRGFGTNKSLNRDNGGRVGLLWFVGVKWWLLCILQMERRNSNFALARLLDWHAEHLVGMPGPQCLALPRQCGAHPLFVAEAKIVVTLEHSKRPIQHTFCHSEYGFMSSVSTVKMIDKSAMSFQSPQLLKMCVAFAWVKSII